MFYGFLPIVSATHKAEAGLLKPRSSRSAFETYWHSILKQNKQQEKPNVLR